ncbi:MAG TPA: exo-alpha-sialidase [Thermoguttaceae bacterium]|nr:exo-alpha-sialidase [Thermoguttaceae bacterium]
MRGILSMVFGGCVLWTAWWGVAAERGSDGNRPGQYFPGALDAERMDGRMLAKAEIAAISPDTAHPRTRDWRNIRTGYPIPDENYCDQPYVVVTKQGHWICVLTTGPGKESEPGQHVVATISTDQGRTWSSLIDIEPSGEIESSWVVPLMTPYGRIYAFYNYNGDRIRKLPRPPYQATTLGWYVFKYSDDGGRTWSTQRYRLPIRLTACDRANDWQGKVQMFWGIDKPNIVGGDVVFAFTKLGRHMLELGEGWLFRSPNLLTERDPLKIQWQLLPEGEHGIRAEEFGSVQEEHNIVPLSDGSLYCVYRTTQGYPCHSYSRDGGRTWTRPEPMTYSPGGRRIKHPRACPMVWRTQEGKYLFWFHNHGGRSYEGRNPVWIAGGVERAGRIHWSQPEILLYDPDPNARISYPDLIEQDGRYWVSETQKSIARIHPIDKTLLEGLWTQGQIKEVSRNGLLLDADSQQIAAGEADLPGRPLDLGRTGGLTVEVWVRFTRLQAGQVLLDCRQRNGGGIRLTTTEQKTVRLELSDGVHSASWDTDSGVLQPGKFHHIVAIVDDGPKVICFVVDGILCDGGQDRQFGWGRYSSDLGDVSGTQKLLLAPSLQGELVRVRLYERALRISEAVAHQQAGP